MIESTRINWPADYLTHLEDYIEVLQGRPEHLELLGCLLRHRDEFLRLRGVTP